MSSQTNLAEESSSDSEKICTKCSFNFVAWPECPYCLAKKRDLLWSQLKASFTNEQKELYDSYMQINERLS